MLRELAATAALPRSRRLSGMHLNFTGLADEPMRAGVNDALGRNLRRLAEIKATYDPRNFFRYNNILPLMVSSSVKMDLTIASGDHG